MRDLTPEVKRYFRDQLRSARARSLSDAEGFHHLMAAIERLGAYRNGGGVGLGKLRKSFAGLLASAEVHDVERFFRTPFDVLFKLVQHNRNAAVHEGAYARHLARQCVELALLLEEALMAEANQICDFMVREPVCAEEWQPVSYARQQMLLHSFSFLPIRREDGWYLVSDYAVAKYVTAAPKPGPALATPLKEAARSSLVLERAVEMKPTASKTEALNASAPSMPVLVTENGRLLGIATPFDLL